MLEENVGRPCKLRLVFRLSVAILFVMVIMFIGMHQHQSSLSVSSGPSLNQAVSDSSLSASSGAVYVITQSYGGQMTRAIRNLMVQQCWASTALGNNAVIAEPFSRDSQLLHSPQMWSDVRANQTRKMAKFGDYYDIEYYNKQSMEEKYAPLISWEKFLKEAPRKAVVVRIPTQKCDKSSSYKNDSNSECTYSKPFSLFIEALSKMGFETIKNVCINCSTVHQPLKVEDLLFSNHNLKNISIFISSWRNFGFIFNWLQIPTSCKLAENPRSSNRLIPSAMIVHHSQYYINEFIGKNYAVAIMLRTERLLDLAATGRLSESLESCLNKTLLLHDKLKKSTSHGTFITVDIGRYGSGRMQDVHNLVNGSIKSISQSVEFFFGKVFNRKLTLKDWEDTFVDTTGGFIERGYIAMLQQHIASQSECLILMGGGSFQQVAAFQYLKNRGDHKVCLHTVCTTENFKRLFDN